MTKKETKTIKEMITVAKIWKEMALEDATNHKAIGNFLASASVKSKAQGFEKLESLAKSLLK